MYSPVQTAAEVMWMELNNEIERIQGEDDTVQNGIEENHDKFILAHPSYDSNQYLLKSF